MDLENEVFNYKRQSDMLPQGLFSLRTDLENYRKRVKTGFYHPKPRLIDLMANVWAEENVSTDLDRERREIFIDQTRRLNKEEKSHEGESRMENDEQMPNEDGDQEHPTEMDNQMVEKDSEMQPSVMVLPPEAEIASSVSSLMDLSPTTPEFSSAPLVLTQTDSSSLQSSTDTSLTPKQSTQLEFDCSLESEDNLKTVVEKVESFLGLKYQTIQLPLIREPKLVLQKNQEPRKDENKEDLLNSLYSALVSTPSSDIASDMKVSEDMLDSNPLFTDFKVYSLPPIHNATPYSVSSNKQATSSGSVPIPLLSFFDHSHHPSRSDPWKVYPSCLNEEQSLFVSLPYHHHYLNQRELDYDYEQPYCYE